MTEDQETPQEAPDLAAELEAERAAHRTTRADLTAALATAAGRYREVLLAGNPQVPPELVAGESIGAVDAALESAKATVAAVIQRATLGVAQAPSPVSPPSPVQAPVQVPAGAPVRTGPDTSAMTAAEKIRYALSTP